MKQQIAWHLAYMAALRADIAYLKTRIQTKQVKGELWDMRANYYKAYHVVRNLRLAPWLYE